MNRREMVAAMLAAVIPVPVPKPAWKSWTPNASGANTASVMEIAKQLKAEYAQIKRRQSRAPFIEFYDGRRWVPYKG